MYNEKDFTWGTFRTFTIGSVERRLKLHNNFYGTIFAFIEMLHTCKLEPAAVKGMYQKRTTNGRTPVFDIAFSYCIDYKKESSLDAVHPSCKRYRN